MPQHKATVQYTNMKTGQKETTVAYSGNHKWGRTRNANAIAFKKYLENLPRASVVVSGRTPRERDLENKNPFTCAEPQAIYNALKKGANPESIRFISITCNGSPRTPCVEYCAQYITQQLRLNWNEIVPPVISITLDEYQDKQKKLKQKAKQNSKKNLSSNPFAALIGDEGV